MISELESTYLDLLLCRQSSWDETVKYAIEKHKDQLTVEIKNSDWAHRDDVLLAFNDAISEEVESENNNDDSKTE